MLTDLGDALRDLYASAHSVDVRRARRAAILEVATHALGGQSLQTSRYVDIDFTRFNNAVLLHQLLYRRELAAFEELWTSDEEDLRRTIRTIDDVAQGRDDPFSAVAAARN